MNRLSKAQRAQIIAMLVEGMSMRSITRITGVSINTVSKLPTDAGEAAAKYHSHVDGIEGYRRIECNEVWAFVYAKERTVQLGTKAARRAQGAHGRSPPSTRSPS